MNTIEKVREFHVAFGIDNPEKPCLPGLDRHVNAELVDSARKLQYISKWLANVCLNRNGSVVAMRAHLMVEELGELLRAMAEGDLVQVLHESRDLQVVLDGTMLALGLADKCERASDMIHEANMSKLEDGKPVKTAAGRIIKGRNFKKADLSSLFEKMRTSHASNA